MNKDKKMIDKKFTKFLEKKIGRVLPEYREKYLKAFSDLGFSNENKDFIEFWSNFNDEIPAKAGFLYAFGDEVLDIKNGPTESLRKHVELPKNLYPLFNFEFDDYMFYDKDTDEVFLVLAPDLKKFINDRFYNKKWDSFLEFIKYQLKYKH